MAAANNNNNGSGIGHNNQYNNITLLSSSTYSNNTNNNMGGNSNNTFDPLTRKKNIIVDRKLIKNSEVSQQDDDEFLRVVQDYYQSSSNNLETIFENFPHKTRQQVAQMASLHLIQELSEKKLEDLDMASISSLFQFDFTFWSKGEDDLFEMGLSQFPRDTPNRFLLITQKVGTKSLSEVLTRYIKLIFDLHRMEAGDSNVSVQYVSKPIISPASRSNYASNASTPSMAFASHELSDNQSPSSHAVNLNSLYNYGISPFGPVL